MKVLAVIIIKKLFKETKLSLYFYATLVIMYGQWVKKVNIWSHIITETFQGTVKQKKNVLTARKKMGLFSDIWLASQKGGTSLFCALGQKGKGYDYNSKFYC
jgi:hypothetical protein|tara:strand:+ start:1476 stop:1781 length:306 start_codon:yes stop_codon:yes gene_type:complete